MSNFVKIVKKIKIVKIAKNCQMLSKIVKIVKNSQKLSKGSKIVNIVKIVENCQKMSKIVNMLVRSCFLITLVKCLKGHKSVGSLCNVKSKSTVSQSVTRLPIELLWTAKEANREKRKQTSYFIQLWNRHCILANN